ncbi:MAG TPA: sulfocyanin-like copper-binding protein [Spirochaetia bacterium]|nr:sulfocyanin-like copper-binding protein [Spirochaetia bacterium]
MSRQTQQVFHSKGGASVRPSARERRAISRVLVFLGFVALAAAVSAASVVAQPAGYKVYSGKPPIILSSDPAQKNAALEIVGSDGIGALGFNFNGYANGDMVVQVPAGWTISVTFKVDSVFHHSLAIVPWQQRKAHVFSDAFPGSSIPDPKAGIRRSSRPVTFSFVAESAGQYAMVCEVPGHDDLGMWDEFDVVQGLEAPAVFVR